MRKPAFCICENKDADQLRGNRKADQRLCFHYIASTLPLLPKYKISSFWLSSVAVQPSLCETWSETPKTRFLTTRLKYAHHLNFWFSVNARLAPHLSIYHMKRHMLSFSYGLYCLSRLCNYFEYFIRRDKKQNTLTTYKHNLNWLVLHGTQARFKPTVL